MNKRLKWGLTAVVLAGAAALGAYSMLPQENEELAAADKVSKAQPKKNILNVNAIIAKPQTLSDNIFINGSLLPDEEVDLSFETSGKIVEINFKEGSFVKKGDLLAKVNDKIAPVDEVFPAYILYTCYIGPEGSGAFWGEVADKDLPQAMKVDWLRVYK